MTGNRFTGEYDPAFESRASAATPAAPEESDAPRPATAMDRTDDPGGGGLGNDLLSAAGNTAAAAAAASPIGAAVANAENLIDTGKDLAHSADDAVKSVGDAISDLFGGGDDHPGESTFPTEAAPPETQEQADARNEANLAAADAKAAARQAEVEMREHVDQARHHQIQDTSTGQATLVTDEHHQFVDDLDGQVAAGAALGAPTFHHGMTGGGAGSAAVTGAPDDVMQPVGELRPDVTFGARTGIDHSAGAPDGVMQPVAELRPDVTFGARTGIDHSAGAPDGVMQPVAELRPDVTFGARTGIDHSAGAPDGVMQPVAELRPDVTFGAGLDSGPSGTGAAQAEAGAPDAALQPVEEASPAAPAGAEAAIHPEPSNDVNVHDVQPGEAVELNPQPIPPGLGADIPVGEPSPHSSVATPAAHPVGAGHTSGVPTHDDSSIIIVGGHDAPKAAELHDDPATNDVASAIAEDSDAPTGHSAEAHDEPVEHTILEDHGDS